MKDKYELSDDLDKALDYYCEYASLKELLDNAKWYNVINIYELKNVMFESYLDSYEYDELKERIQDLYK